MKNPRFLFRTALMIFAVGVPFCLGDQAFGQGFPNRPITIYCSMSAGGGQDITARLLASEAQKDLGVPIVVESKTGGGSTVAAALVASKKPDGYTLAILSYQALAQNCLMFEVAYDPFKDFTLLCEYANYPNAVCVKSDSRFKTLNDLLDYARNNPGTLSYSSAGTGGTAHLFVEYLAKQAQVKFKHVPFPGGATACTALLGGHVDFTGGTGTHLSYVKQGVFRMLAVVYPNKRYREYPDVPTLSELGYKNIPPGGWVIVGPRGLPEPVFNKLDAAIRKAAHSAKFQELLENLSLILSYKDRPKLEAELPDVYRFYAEFLKEIGIEAKKKK